MIEPLARQEAEYATLASLFIQPRREFPHLRAGRGSREFQRRSGSGLDSLIGRGAGQSGPDATSRDACDDALRTDGPRGLRARNRASELVIVDPASLHEVIDSLTGVVARCSSAAHERLGLDAAERTDGEARLESQSRLAVRRGVLDPLQQRVAHCSARDKPETCRGLGVDPPRLAAADASHDAPGLGGVGAEFGDDRSVAHVIWSRSDEISPIAFCSPEARAATSPARSVAAAAALSSSAICDIALW